MTEQERTKFVSDVEITEDNVRVKQPLKLQSENQRRFVRLTISSPINFRSIKDIFGNFSPNPGEYPIDGTILNISEGGVLAEMDQPLNEGDIVAMRIIMEQVEPIEGVLGLVKRCDQDDDYHLVGIQFVRRDELVDKLSQSEMELLSEDLSHFTQSVQELLSRYLQDKRTRA
ncbi:MAG: PilZ domain-containing protein [candidate division Zixibacteria bacterium]|nr:PilZ domain-containing protein [candidate division Zixibacteria bacterium]MDH3936538.1 PilZ domain-containing protein [candidate division Zixibacteria bacterium]MDH4032299.1 PilZ domain-containing protein [candidate division Zixibacteria bacterium]